MNRIEQLVSDSESMSLVIGWRRGRHLETRFVSTSGDVDAALREAARQAAATLDESGRDYDPDDDQEDARYLVVDADELLDSELVNALLSGPSLTVADKADFDRQLAFYAVILGSSERRVAMVRRGSPVRLAKKGIVAIFGETLSRVEDPIFAFDELFDVIVLGTAGVTETWALHQKNFEALFKDSEVVIANASTWVDEMADYLPLESAGKAYLTERLRKNSVLRRKVLSIRRRDHFRKLVPADIRAAIERHGLNPEMLNENDELVFSSTTEKELLLLLNEDLFTGEFSNNPYAATKKASRSDG